MSISKKIEECLLKKQSRTAKEIAFELNEPHRRISDLLHSMKQNNKIYIDSYDDSMNRPARYSIGNNKDAVYICDKERKRKFSRLSSARYRMKQKLILNNQFGPFSCVVVQITK